MVDIKRSDGPTASADALRDSEARFREAGRLYQSVGLDG